MQTFIPLDDLHDNVVSFTKCSAYSGVRTELSWLHPLRYVGTRPSWPFYPYDSAFEHRYYPLKYTCSYSTYDIARIS